MTDAMFADACTAVEDVLPQFTDMLRRNPSVTAPAVGTWTLPDVACHVSHVVEKDTDALRGEPLPEVELSPAAVAVATNSMLDEDPERDPELITSGSPRSWGSYLLRISALPFLALRVRDIFLFPFGYRGDVDYIHP